MSIVLLSYKLKSLRRIFWLSVMIYISINTVSLYFQCYTYSMRTCMLDILNRSLLSFNLIHFVMILKTIWRSIYKTRKPPVNWFQRHFPALFALMLISSFSLAFELPMYHFPIVPIICSSLWDGITYLLIAYTSKNNPREYV